MEAMCDACARKLARVAEFSGGDCQRLRHDFHHHDRREAEAAAAAAAAAAVNQSDC